MRGKKGVHAEIKLLEHLETLVAGRSLPTLPATEKAILLGERFPCAACRLFAVDYEPYTQLLPSHGHLYISTLDSTISRHMERRTRPSAASLVSMAATSVCDRFTPSGAAAVLLEKGAGRVLQG